ncbi:MAG: hypothetical protein ACRC1K_04895 [Planctomycetia bacterium]
MTRYYRSSALASLGMALLVASLAPAPTVQGASKPKKDGVADVVGTIWTFTAVKKGETETGKFRVYKKEVFKGDQKVGYVDPKDDDETKLVIDGFPKLNGTSILRKTKTRPVKWTGDLIHTDGSKWELTVVVKDK